MGDSLVGKGKPEVLIKPPCPERVPARGKVRCRQAEEKAPGSHKWYIGTEACEATLSDRVNRILVEF